MNIYEKNLEFFRTKLPGVYETLNQEKEIYDIRVEKVAEQWNFIAEGQSRCFINSLYDKEREMQQMFKDVQEDTTDLLVLGFGCGYAADYINKNFPHIKHLYFIEPCLDLFKKVVEGYDFEKMFLEGKKTITFLLNTKPEMLADLIERVVNNKFGVGAVYHLSYCSLFPGEYEVIYNKTSEMIRKTMVNLATDTLVNYTWPENALNNLLQESMPAEMLMDRIKGQTAIIVAAGPSLEKNMHLLSELKDRALILAVGSAIKVLDSHGIVPHLRCAIDGNSSEAIFNPIDTSAAPILYAGSLHKDVLTEYKGKKIEFLLDTDLLSRYIYKQSGRQGILIRSGFSIANVIFDFLCKAGCSRIILMGQDLCYTGDKLYAEGSWTDIRVSDGGSEFVKVQDIYGEDVYSTAPLLGMRSLFEGLIKDYPEVEVINATEGGLPIKNAKNMSLKAVMNKLDSELNPSRILDESFAEYEDMNRQGDQNKLYPVIERIEEDVEQIFLLCEEKLKRMKKINRYRLKNMGISKLLEEIRYLDNYDNELKNNYFYVEVLKPSLNKIIEAIENNFRYNGEDQHKLLEAEEKALFRKVLEIRKYSLMCKKLIEEYKDKQAVAV